MPGLTGLAEQMTSGESGVLKKDSSVQNFVQLAAIILLGY